MKRITFCLASILLLSGLANAQPAATVQHQSAELGLTTVTVEDVTYDKVFLPNTISTMVPGEPQLPVQLVYLVIPKDIMVEDVAIVSSSSVTLDGTYNILPAQLPAPISGDIPPFTTPSSEVYSSAETYPGRLVEIVNDGQDESGQKAASGVYFYRLDTDVFKATKKMVVIK